MPVGHCAKSTCQVTSNDVLIWSSLPFSLSRRLIDNTLDLSGLVRDVTASGQLQTRLFHFQVFEPVLAFLSISDESGHVKFRDQFLPLKDFESDHCCLLHWTIANLDVFDKMNGVSELSTSQTGTQNDAKTCGLAIYIDVSVSPALLVEPISRCC